LRFLWTKRIAVKKTVLFHAAFTTCVKKNGDLFFNKVEERLKVIQKMTTLLEGDPQCTVLRPQESHSPCCGAKGSTVDGISTGKVLRGVKVNDED
jgi:hypothetical protein